MRRKSKTSKLASRDSFGDLLYLLVYTCMRVLCSVIKVTTAKEGHEDEPVIAPELNTIQHV